MDLRTEVTQPDRAFEEKLEQANMARDPVAGLANAAKAMSARQALLVHINEQEQRLLDKIATLRGLRELVQFARLSEAELLQKYLTLEERLY